MGRDGGVAPNGPSYGTAAGATGREAGVAPNGRSYDAAGATDRPVCALCMMASMIARSAAPSRSVACGSTCPSSARA